MASCRDLANICRANIATACQHVAGGDRESVSAVESSHSGFRSIGRCPPGRHEPRHRGSRRARLPSAHRATRRTPCSNRDISTPSSATLPFVGQRAAHPAGRDVIGWLPDPQWHGSHRESVGATASRSLCPLHGSPCTSLSSGQWPRRTAADANRPTSFGGPVRLLRAPERVRRGVRSCRYPYGSGQSPHPRRGR